MGTYIGSSPKPSLSDALATTLNTETSFARKVELETGVSWFGQVGAMARLANTLSGLSASTTDLNTLGTGLGTAIKCSTGQINALSRFGPGTRAWALAFWYKNVPASPGIRAFFVQATIAWVSGSFNWQCGTRFRNIKAAWGGPSTRHCGAMIGKGRCPTTQSVWVTTNATGVRIQYYTHVSGTLRGLASSLVLWGAATPVRTCLVALGY
jgi:hypothetical protein